MGREKERIRVVVDSNVAFSFIIKGRNNAYMDIFSKDNLDMYAPEDILYEFGKYNEELKSKSEEFEETVFLVFSFVRIIPREVYLDSFAGSSTKKIHHSLD